MKKNIGKILAIIGGLILVIGIVFAVQEKFGDSTDKKNPSIDHNDKEPTEDFENKKIEELQPEEQTKEEINELVDALFKEDVTRTKLEEIIGQPIENYYIFYGKDSYIRTLGSDISGLDQYKKKQSELAKNLESKIKDNFDVQIKEYIVSADGAIVQKLTYRVYYYQQFVLDYDFLVNELLQYTDLDLDNITDGNMTQEDQIKIYKIQIKSLEIMSNYFNDYKNDNEIKEYEIIYRKGDNEILNEYLSLFINFNGGFYNNQNLSSSTRENRVKSYINDAISSGQLDTNDPYKLK